MAQIVEEVGQRNQSKVFGIPLLPLSADEPDYIKADGLVTEALRLKCEQYSSMCSPPPGLPCPASPQKVVVETCEDYHSICGTPPGLPCPISVQTHALAMQDKLSLRSRASSTSTDCGEGQSDDSPSLSSQCDESEGWERVETPKNKETPKNENLVTFGHTVDFGDDTVSLVLQHIPARAKAAEIIEAIDDLGFSDVCTFVYCPMQINKGRPLNRRGTAYCGFINPTWTKKFAEAITGHRFKGRSSTKTVTVAPARLQGLNANSAEHVHNRGMSQYLLSIKGSHIVGWGR